MNPTTEDFTEKWRLAAGEWLDAQDAADLLNDAKHDTLAEIASRMDGSSQAAKVESARKTEEWLSFRSQMTAANTKARRLKFRVTFAKMQREDHLNGEANRRAEMKL